MPDAGRGRTTVLVLFNGGEDRKTFRLPVVPMPGLKAAIGSPEDALNVCGDVAQRITTETALGQGFHVSRTALRWRNPANVASRRWS